MLAITVGAGVDRPRGRSISLPQTSTPRDGVVLVLEQQKPAPEAWWSLCTWKDNHRSIENWQSAVGVMVDVDFKKAKDVFPGPELTTARDNAFSSGMFPGSAWHPTPHGFRCLFLFEQPYTEREQYRRACFGAVAIVDKSLKHFRLTEYEVDVPASTDLGRLFFTPNSIAKSVERSDSVTLLRSAPYTADELAEHAPAITVEEKPTDTPKKTNGTNGRATTTDDFDTAVDMWLSSHPETYPPSGRGDCPVCKHKKCFGQARNNKWACFSKNHVDECGAPSKEGNCYTGDALDLEAYSRFNNSSREARRDVLIADGCLSPSKKKTTTPPPPLEHEPINDGLEEAEIIDISSVSRPWKSRSYLTAVDIITLASTKPIASRGILGNKSLGFNEMTGNHELGGLPLIDEQVSKIRSEMERRFSGGVDKTGNEVGLQIAQNDIERAINQVARDNSYHPVKQYLESLAWDGESRISHLCEDVLKCERTILNQAIVYRFFLAAVARAMQPGCKVDTMWILVGKQGCGKSSFFNVLGGKWFIDSPIDIRNKDAYQVLRNAWIAEWPELDSLSRAREIDTVKAFLASKADNYRPSYGRRNIEVPRSSMIVGTTNHEEFLVDETGNRRFWIMLVGKIDLEMLFGMRDQLWAEAMSIYKTACNYCLSRAFKRCRDHKWWLSSVEQALLDTNNQQHMMSDAWDSVLFEWLLDPRLPENPALPAGPQNPLLAFTGAPTTADLLTGALSKPRGQWTRADEMRVAKLMRQFGWDRGSIRTGETVIKAWKKVDKQ